VACVQDPDQVCKHRFPDTDFNFMKKIYHEEFVVILLYSRE